MDRNQPLQFILSLISIGFQTGRALRERSEKRGRIYFVVMGILLMVLMPLFWIAYRQGTLITLLGAPLPWIELFLSPGSKGATPSFLPRTGGLIILVFCYVVLFSFPLSVLFLPFARKVKSSRPRLRSFSEKVFRMWAARCPTDSYFAGIDTQNGRPVYISLDSRLMHNQIVGVTGAAKTEGGIVPALLHDIGTGSGTLVICMKGDQSLLDRVTAVAKACGRLNDLLLFSMPFPESSNTYNPLERGNPTEIKDKVTSSSLWTEEYYKKLSEMAVLIVINAMTALKKPVTLATLRDNLSSVRNIEALAAELNASKTPHQINELLSVLDRSIQPISGLLADLTALVTSDFGHLLREDKGEISLLDAYLNRKILYFQLNAGLYQETAIRLARLVIQDIKSMCNYVQAYIPENERRFFSVFIDDFASVAFPPFAELINKARSSKVAITIAHQSLGDLRQYGDYFDSQIFESTNLKMIFRQTDPRSVNLITEMGGTVEAEKMTRQTSDLLGEFMDTGLGSARMVEKFRIDPNIIRDLPRGHCVLIQRDINRICYLQTDYLPFQGPAGFLEGRRKNRPLNPPVVPTPKSKEKTETKSGRLKCYLIK